MPRSAYIMLSVSGSVDQFQNKLSIFDVVEVITVSSFQEESQAKQPGKSLDMEQSTRVADPTPAIMGPPLRLVSTWMREEGDTPEIRFESQVACLCPDGQELFITAPQELQFSEFFHRLIVPEFQFPDLPLAGVYLLEGRLRRAGDQSWEWRQTYPFLVRELPAAQPSESSSS